MARTKILPIVLKPAEYAELERRAKADDRLAIQQARWMLRQALSTSETNTEPSEMASAVPA